MTAAKLEQGFSYSTIIPLPIYKKDRVKKADSENIEQPLED